MSWDTTVGSKSDHSKSQTQDGLIAYGKVAGSFKKKLMRQHQAKRSHGPLALHQFPVQLYELLSCSPWLLSRCTSNNRYTPLRECDNSSYNIQQMSRTWNHLACRSDANAAKHFGLSRTSGSSSATGENWVDKEEVKRCLGTTNNNV